MNYTFSAIAIIKGRETPLSITIDFVDLGYVKNRWKHIEGFERFEVEPHLIN